MANVDFHGKNVFQKYKKGYKIFYHGLYVVNRTLRVIERRKWLKYGPIQ